MNKIIVLCGLVLLLSGCHNYSSNVGETLGCVLAGNGCDDGRTGATGAAGSSTRLSIVNEGTGYATTDGRPCTFNVSATEVSWPGGSATY